MRWRTMRAESSYTTRSRPLGRVAARWVAHSRTSSTTTRESVSSRRRATSTMAGCPDTQCRTIGSTHSSRTEPRSPTSRAVPPATASGTPAMSAGSSTPLAVRTATRSPARASDPAGAPVAAASMDWATAWTDSPRATTSRGRRSTRIRRSGAPWIRTSLTPAIASISAASSSARSSCCTSPVSATCTIGTTSLATKARGVVLSSGRSSTAATSRSTASRASSTSVPRANSRVTRARPSVASL